MTSPVSSPLVKIPELTRIISPENNEVSSLLSIETIVAQENREEDVVVGETEVKVITEDTTRNTKRNMIIGIGALLIAGSLFSAFVSGNRHYSSDEKSVSSSPFVKERIFPVTAEKTHQQSHKDERNFFEKSKSAKKTKNVKEEPAVPLIDRMSYEVIGPAKAYDRRFMSDWWGMMRQLWTADGGANGIRSAMPTSVIDYLPRENEKPYRAEKLVAQWMSPDCKFLDLNLKHIRTLQDGSSNQVLLMKDSNNNKRYVIKTISNPDAFLNELILFMFIDPKHPYFSRAVCNRRVKHDDGTSTAKIIFEYVAGVESLEFARTAKFSDLKKITAQLFLAVEHMHYLKFIHADLKPHNVLIDLNGNVKVIDFGFSAQLPYGKKAQGTHFTMAPELHGKVPGMIHEGVDWWAFGSTVAMWFGAYYDEKKFMSSHDGKASGRKGHKNTCILMNWSDDHFEAGKVPREFPESLRSFLYMFHSVDPDTRLFNTPRLLKLIRSHEFFSDINWSDFHGGDFSKVYQVSE